jgi:hypothetical protein
MSDDKAIQGVMDALGGKDAKAGAGPGPDTVSTTGNAIEDLGAVVKTEVSQDLQALAFEAAIAADESREAGAKAKELKAELDTEMKAAGIAEIEMPDRDPIAYKVSKSKDKTLTALKKKASAEAKADGHDEKHAAKAAKILWDDFWGRFPMVERRTLSIPGRHAPSE